MTGQPAAGATPTPRRTGRGLPRAWWAGPAALATVAAGAVATLVAAPSSFTPPRLPHALELGNGTRPSSTAAASARVPGTGAASRPGSARPATGAARQPRVVLVTRPVVTQPAAGSESAGPGDTASSASSASPAAPSASPTAPPETGLDPPDPWGTGDTAGGAGTEAPGSTGGSERTAGAQPDNASTGGDG
jgi:hypothetical protein